MRRIRAALVEERGGPIRVQEVDLDDPGEGEVRVKLVASGVCHSCLHAADGSWTTFPMPIVLGDEGAGVVDATGPGVRGVREGDHVVLSWSPSCGLCHYCVTGRPVLCERRAPRPGTLPDGSTRLHWRGAPLYHFGTVASHAEYTTIPESCAVPIRHDVPLESVALIGCSVMTGVGSVLNTAQVPAGASMAVFGAGGIGLNSIQGGALAGAQPIIAVDVLPQKLEYARRFGATHAIDASKDDPVAAIKDLTRRGADYTFVAVGNARVINQAWDALAPGGTCVLIGLPATAETVTFTALSLQANEKVLRGSRYGSARMRDDFPRMVELYRSGKLKIDELINRRFTLDETDAAYKALAAGELARGVIVN
ncbi:MAG TPA: Zn-dependent alcohol dehydrogenase [Chloroflexota bacterium]|nr:Zn-dependent alcohol dehydrogenase [Chloroflexota bacterium]